MADNSSSDPFGFAAPASTPGPRRGTSPAVANQPGVNTANVGRPPEDLGELVAPPVGIPAAPRAGLQTKLSGLVLPPDALPFSQPQPAVGSAGDTPETKPQEADFSTSGQPAAQPQPQQEQPSAPGAVQPAAAPNRLSMPRMPQDFEVMAMPDGVTVETSVGTLMKRGGKAEVTLNAAGHDSYKRHMAKAISEFGEHPYSGDPLAPEPPIELGKAAFNPFTGVWSGGKRSS